MSCNVRLETRARLPRRLQAVVVADSPLRQISFVTLTCQKWDFASKVSMLRVVHVNLCVARRSLRARAGRAARDAPLAGSRPASSVLQASEPHSTRLLFSTFNERLSLRALSSSRVSLTRELPTSRESHSYPLQLTRHSSRGAGIEIRSSKCMCCADNACEAMVQWHRPRHLMHLVSAQRTARKKRTGEWHTVRRELERSPVLFGCLVLAWPVASIRGDVPFLIFGEPLASNGERH